VSGLVKICFPHGLIEQLGIDMVQKHMKEQKAPAENIAKMMEAFRPETMHRIIGMLAEYLDSPSKVRDCIQSIIAASSSLHVEVRADQFEDILTSQDAGSPSAETRDVDHNQPSAQKPSERTQDHEEYDFHEEFVDAEEPIRRRQQSRLNKRVSGTWRWDIDPDKIPREHFVHVFKKPSDLFAFHALRIAKDLIAPITTKREIRKTIQAMLDDMEIDTYNKWAESFDKLHDGDDTMLIRVPPERAPKGRIAMTPAPTEARRQTTRGAERNTTPPEAIAPWNSRIKREGNSGSKVSGLGARRVPEESHRVSTVTSAVIGQTSTAEVQNQVTRNIRASRRMIRLTSSNYESAEGLESRILRSQTPIIDVLWGSDDFTQEKETAA
jgi:hypothetical protein